MNIMLRRVTAAILVLIMILGNFVFSGNEVLAEEGSFSEISGVIDPRWHELENDIGILYDLVDKGDTDQGIKLVGIESNLIQISYTAAVDDGVVINEGLSGQRMTFTLETGLSGVRSNFDDYSAAMTIPDNIDISTFEFNSENVTREYTFGKINGKNALIVNFGEAKVGSTVTVSWSASYKTETTPNGYEGTSLVYVTGIPYIPGDNGEKIYEDPKMPKWKEAEATAVALADSEVTIVKSIINGNNGKAYEKELIYDVNGKFDKYVYTVTYSIDVIRNKKVREFGSLMIDAFQLKDIIEGGAGGGKAAISLGDESYGEPQTDLATSTITWNFKSEDFTDLNTANNNDIYRLKKPVIVKAVYDENSFVAQQPGVMLRNIATGSGQFVDGTEINPNQGEVSFILPDKSNINPGIKVTKTLAPGENPVTYADPLNGKLPLGFNLTISNTGNVIADAIITDSDITLKDKDENDLPSVAGKDYIINGITLPAWSGLRQFAGIDVYYKSAEGNYLKTGETYADFTAPVTITPEQTWYGIKIEVLDLVEDARVEDIRLDIELNNTDIFAGNVDDEGNFTGLVEIAGNKVQGSYRYKGVEEAAGESDAKWNIRYNPILPAKLEKSITACQFDFADFKHGKDMEFNVTFENTTGYKLDTLTISDNEIKFYDAASNPRSQVDLPYEIIGLTAKKGLFDIPAEDISVDEKGFVCNLKDVDKGEIITFKIAVRVTNADMTPFKTVENNASAKYTYGGYEKTIYADTAVVNVNTDAKGYIAKTTQSRTIPLFDEDGKGLYVSSQFLKYTITVRNDGQTELERYKVYEDYTENSQNPNNPEDASNSLNMQLRSEDKSAYIFPNGKAFSDFARITDVEMDQQKPGESKPQILEDGAAFSAVFNNLAIGETRTLTVTAELYKVNPGEEYWWISNEARYSYKINASEKEYTKGGKSETVWTEIIKPDVTARLNKANTFAKSDELVLMEQTSYTIDAIIATNVGLKTLTITDDGLQFLKTGTEDSITFESGKTKYDYAWIDKITVPDFFAQTGETGAYEPFYGDDISNVKAYIEYRLVGSGDNQAGDWEAYSLNLNGAGIYTNGKFTLTANEIKQGAKFAEVRIVFENFPPKINLDGTPLERRLGTKDCPIEVGVQLRELLLLSFQQKALDPAGNPTGKFDLKNNATMDWTFGNGIGVGSGQAVINGDVAVISESDAVVNHRKAVSPNSIQFSPELKGGTTLKYTFTNENVGPDIGQLAIYDSGLILLSSNRTIIPSPPDYELKNVVVEITSPEEVKDYKGGVILYWSKTKNGSTDSSFDDNHYISLPYSESGIYSFTGVNGLEDGVLRFKIVFGDSMNPVPKGFKAVTKFDAKIAAKEDLWDDVQTIRNVSKATYKFVGRNDEYLASQKLADTNVLTVLAADVFKTAKAGVYNTGMNQYPAAADGKDNKIHISMKNVFEKGVGVSYKITAENSGTLSADMTITDKTKMVYSGDDKPNTNPEGGIMHLQYLMVPKALAEGNNIVSMIPISGDQNAPDGIEFVQSGDELDGYYKYTVSQDYDADSFEIVLKDIAAGEKFDIYADYIVKADYNAATRMIEDIVNTVTVAVNRGGKQEIAYDEIHESVDNDGIVYMNINLNKTVSNADINLSKLLKGDMEVTYTIDNIGHAENSRDNMIDYILSDNGMTIYNLINGNEYSPDTKSGNKSMDYAWFNKIIFPAHGVYFDEDKSEPLVLKITYYVYDGVSIKEESRIWTADINSIIQAADGEKIVAFKAEAPILPQEFKNIKVTVKATIKQADDKSDFYGYIGGDYPDVETDIFNIGNTARQTAKNPYEEGKVLEIEKDCGIRVKASNNPNFNLKKQSIPSVIEKASWYMADQLIRYEITGILNDTDETLDEVVITDDNMKINVKAGAEDADLSFAIKSIGLKLDESGIELEKLRNAEGFQISYETENKTLTNVTEAFLRDGVFNVNAIDLGRTYKIIIENVPPSFGLVIDFKVSLDRPENYEKLANIVSITNEAKLSYLFKEKTTTVYSAQNTVDIKEEPQDFSIFKSSPKQKYDKGEKVQWDIYLINNDPGSVNRPSILVDPTVWDVLPYSFSDPNAIKMIEPKSITYGTMTEEEIAAHDFSNISETDIGIRCVDGNGVKSQEITGNRPLNKITWQFEGELNYKEVIHIRFEASLDKFAEPVSAVNKVYAKSEAQNTETKEARAAINVINNTNVIAKVESNGNLNPAGVYYAFPPIATAMPGSIANYKISVANYSAGSAKIQGIKMADLLPYLVSGGDKETGIIDIWDDRGSEWQPTLLNIGAYKVYSLDPDGNEIYNEEKTKELNETPPTVYLSETRDGRVIENAMKNNDFSGWTIMDEYTDLSRYNSFVVVFNPDFALEYRERIVFIADVKVPDADDAIWDGIETKMNNVEKADCIAWNSTAVFYDGASFVVEPNMAGINVVFSELGDRVWYDTDGNGLQSAENEDASAKGKATEFTYKDKGVEGLLVFLFKIDDDGNMEYVAQVKTDANGSYRFSRIPEGKYVIGFEKRDSFKFTKRNDTNEYLNSSVYDGQDSKRITTYNDNGKVIDLYLTNPITLGVSSIDRTWDAGITGGGQLTVRKILQNSNGKVIPFEDKTFTVDIFSVDGDGKETKVKSLTFDKDLLEAVVLLPYGEYIVKEADAPKYNVTITDGGKVEFNKDLLNKNITVTNKEKPPVAEPSPSSNPEASPSPSPTASGRPGGGTIINPDTRPTPSPTAIQRITAIPSASVPLSNVSPIPAPTDEIVDVPDESPALGGPVVSESEAVIMPSEEIPARKANPVTGENFIYKYNMIFILGIIIVSLLEIRDIYSKRRKAD